jgi:hypothetical protein
MYFTCTLSCILTIYIKVTPPITGVRCFPNSLHGIKCLGSLPASVPASPVPPVPQSRGHPPRAAPACALLPSACTHQPAPRATLPLPRVTPLPRAPPRARVLSAPARASASRTHVCSELASLLCSIGPSLPIPARPIAVAPYATVIVHSRVHVVSRWILTLGSSRILTLIERG